MFTQYTQFVQKEFVAATNWNEAARANRRLRGWEEKRVCCSPGVLRVQRGLLRSGSSSSREIEETVEVRNG
jgi:hypothetical protein